MANRRILALAAAVALAPTSIPVSQAQMRGATKPAPGYSSPHHGASSFHRRAGIPFGYFLGDSPFLYDDYEPPPQSAPQFVVMQPPIAADTPPQPKSSPLLIELEGDRYVRYGGAERSPETDAPERTDSRPRLSSGAKLRTHQPLSAGHAQSPHADAREKVAVLSAAPLAPTVLVYRDGRREEIPDYAIVGPILYAHSTSKAQPGYGMRSIEVSALDIPATVAANRENGVNFVLPAGSNEVVTRP